MRKAFSWMLLDRIYDEDLAQAGYLVGCQREGVAIVVDPNRDVDRYIAAAAHEKLRIACVTETHIHADFVSGARELAARTGAALLLSGEGGGDWQYEFAKSSGARLVHAGNSIDVGAVRLDVLHTPGHTPEHLAFLVTDRAANGQAMGMLSGDFIFVGDVGRPDLLERAAQVAGSSDALARRLFHSLRAVAALPDYLQIWPGHGAGSACGKSLGAMPSTTLGYERLTNWAFQIADEDIFIAAAKAGQPEPPPYFARMKVVNRDGPSPRPTHSLEELDVSAVRTAMQRGAMVLDVRSTANFAAGHIPGTINLPIGSSFLTWAGWLVPHDRDVILLADDDARIQRARAMLSLIGVDSVTARAGRAVLDAWTSTVGPLQRVEQVDVATLSGANDRVVIDVRNDAEWSEGHLPSAEHMFLGQLVETARALPRDTPLALHCQGGTRSAIAASLLQAEGFTQVANLAGGYKAWVAAGLPTISSAAEMPAALK
jgi:hydroxyacylglutathione hydrolase